MLRGVDRWLHRWLGHVTGRGWITWEMRVGLPWPHSSAVHIKLMLFSRQTFDQKAFRPSDGLPAARTIARSHMRGEVYTERTYQCVNIRPFSHEQVPMPLDARGALRANE